MSETVPEYGGCPWPVDPACFTADWDAMDPTVKARALALASATLQRLTGGRVSNCPITVRPCKATSYDQQRLLMPYRGSSFFPHLNPSGYWINSCGCTGGCTSHCEVTLPGPVGRIDEVRVNGGVLGPNDYRVDNGNILVYVGPGDCVFPSSQDLSRPDTEPGTFSVTYLNAAPVDALGAYAAGVMAMEFAKACTGGKCRLPSNVTSIVRQGVTMELQPGTFPNGQVGIREVDTFISLWNPRNQRGSTVWSPDLARPRITTAARPPFAEIYDGGDPDDFGDQTP